MKEIPDIPPTETRVEAAAPIPREILVAAGNAVCAELTGPNSALVEGSRFNATEVARAALEAAGLVALEAENERLKYRAITNACTCGAFTSGAAHHPRCKAMLIIYGPPPTHEQLVAALEELDHREPPPPHSNKIGNYLPEHRGPG